MAHFARINDEDVVVDVIVISNEDIRDDEGNEIEEIGIELCRKICGLGTWLQTSYNGSFRRRYAVVGGQFDRQADVFLEIQPYPSWILDSNYDWQAPVPMPDDGGDYIWNEEIQTWDEIVVPE
jgi:hypothetical protein